MERSDASTEEGEASFQEKLLAVETEDPYRKWTHMGEERILR